MTESQKLTWKNGKRKLRELKEWALNPRQISQADAERLRESLLEFGQIHVICIDPDNVIIDGHQRKKVWTMAEEFGGDYEVDVRISNRPLTEIERKKLTVYLEKAAGEWDWDILANHWETDELLDWGFTEEELQFGNNGTEAKSNNNVLEVCPKCGYVLSGELVKDE